MNSAQIRKILVISLSNIGDIILTFPVIDILVEGFPRVPISVIVGPKGEELLRGNAALGQIYVFNKRQRLGKTMNWLRELRRERFDLIVDLRNTAIPFFIGGRTVTSPFLRRLPGQHVLSQHLERLRSIYPFQHRAQHRHALQVSSDTESAVARLLEQELGISNDFVVISAGAADQNKRWTESGFAEISDAIIERSKLPVIFVGSNSDTAFTQKILRRMRNPAINICGRTTLGQLAVLLQRCRLAIVNDSAPLHLASYLDVPVLALFGPTDPIKYGPWGNNGQYIVKKEYCPACASPSRKLPHLCMQAIRVDEVLARMEMKNGDVRLKDNVVPLEI